MGDYVHLFADETERTQYERSAQYNEPYISATDDTFDAEYNKRQDRKYAVKYTDTEINVRDFAFVEYDAEIEYLESTGTQYINLDFGFDKTDEIYTSFAILTTTNDKYINSPITWNNNNNRFGMGYHNGGYCIGYGNTSTSNTLLSPKTANDKQIHNWEYKNYIFKIVDLNLTRNVSSITFGDTTKNLRLFYGYNAATQAKIASYKHIKNGQPVIDLIPVRVGNTGYMYDKVSCKLLGNSGSGNFILGPDKYDTQIEYLYNSYNAYIDSKIPFTTNSKWITQFEFQNKGNGGDLFGLRTPWSIIRLNNYIYIDRYYQGSSTYNRVINKKGWWGEANVRKITSIEITDTYVIPDGLASYKTTFASAGTNTYKTLESGGAAICGGLSGQNDPLKIFYFKWYENSTLVLDMIPVRVGNVGYMYDRVSGRLFGNAGLGQFVLGPDVV